MKKVFLPVVILLTFSASVCENLRDQREKDLPQISLIVADERSIQSITC